jgi:natural resistance-associated macrophage protein
MNYKAIWVLLVAHIMLYFFQEMCIDLSAHGKGDFATFIGAKFNTKAKYFVWVSSELAIIAADIQELLGTSIALKLLTGFSGNINLILSVLIVFAVLYIQQAGQTWLEVVFVIFVGTMAICFMANFIAMKPDVGQILDGFVPNIPDTISFATVVGSIIMPQNLFLQSSLVMTRTEHNLHPRRLARIIKVETIVIIVISFIINLTIVGVFGNPYYSEKDITLENAGEHLRFLLSEWSAVFWAIGLLCSGISSTTTGALTGQYLMTGIVNLRVPFFLRILITRLLTLIPCIAILAFFEVDNMINMLNVVQFVQLPFVIIPLLRFVMDPRVMGNRAYTKLHVSFITGLYLGLQLINIFSIYKTTTGPNGEHFLWFVAVIGFQALASFYLMVTDFEKGVVENALGYEDLKSS